MPELETVDIDGVEILSAGGPYHGSGSPKDGDYFTAEFLSALADANTSLAELRPPIKIGHNAAQKLLIDSGLSADEMPAAGWLANIRPGERDGQAKLIADMKSVPKKLAALIKSGAFRTRSVEIGKVYAQAGDKAGNKLTAITAMALLGAKAPAVRTLDDIVALYGDEGVPEEFVGELSEIVVTDMRPGGEGTATITFSTTTPTTAATSGATGTWTASFQTWGDQIEFVDRALWREKEETVMGTEARADTQGMKIKDLSDEQLRTLADTLGVGDDVDGDELRGAVADKMVDLVKDEVEATLVPAPGTVTLSEADVAELRANAGLAKSLAEERRAEKRDVIVDGAVEKGKLAPADADTWRELYDANSEAALKAIEDMPVNVDLVRALGADGGEEGETADANEEAEYREFAASLGLREEG